MSTNKSAVARQLGVSRGSLYYRSKKRVKDEKLRLQIEVVMQNHHSYGHRRIAMELGINKKRILRVMRLFNLKPARRCKTPQKPLDHGLPEMNYPDITRVLSPCAPNFLWVSDFSFISYRGNFIYLATILDLFTARVVGAAVRTHHRVELITAALTDAVQKHKILPEWFHSDQGSEYRAEDIKTLQAFFKIKISMSPKASPWRNGSQESFFGRFKVEFGDPDRFDSLEKLIAAIYASISYYNQERIHTRLKMPPWRFYQKWIDQHSQVIHSYPQVMSLPLGTPSHSFGVV